MKNSHSSNKFSKCFFLDDTLHLKCSCERGAGISNYLWYINTANIHWIDIPKNSSSSIKKRSKWATVHKGRTVRPGTRASKIIKKSKTKPVKNVCVMIRSPEKRLESLIRFYFMSGEKWKEAGRMKDLTNDKLKKILSTPKEFLTYLQNNRKKSCMHHFFPQTEFINRVKEAYPQCKNHIKFCLLEDEKTWHPDWADMSPSKVTDKSLDLTFIKKEIKEIVNTLYLEDLELYNSIVRSCNQD